MISKNVILLATYLHILPIIALFIAAICFALYLLTLFLIKKYSTKSTERHATYNYTNETDAERKARVNAEVDKIIEEQRNNKGQSN
jgi:hypothetical protein